MNAKALITSVATTVAALILYNALVNNNRTLRRLVGG